MKQRGKLTAIDNGSIKGWIRFDSQHLMPRIAIFCDGRPVLSIEQSNVDIRRTKIDGNSTVLFFSAPIPGILYDNRSHVVSAFCNNEQLEIDSALATIKLPYQRPRWRTEITKFDGRVIKGYVRNERNFATQPYVAVICNNKPIARKRANARLPMVSGQEGHGFSIDLRDCWTPDMFFGPVSLHLSDAGAEVGTYNTLSVDPSGYLQLTARYTSQLNILNATLVLPSIYSDDLELGLSINNVPLKGVEQTTKATGRHRNRIDFKVRTSIADERTVLYVTYNGRNICGCEIPIRDGSQTTGVHAAPASGTLTYDAFGTQRRLLLSEFPVYSPPTHLSDELRYKQFPGRVRFKPGKPIVMVVAHVASEHLFGSERSFLDMLEGLAYAELNVVAVVPQNAPRYTNEIRSRSCHVCVFTYRWWRLDESESPSAIALFSDLIDKFQISVVHANTIMLREVHTAAKQLGVTTIVHARELIHSDSALKDLIGLPSDEIVTSTIKRVDWVVANSNATADTFYKPGHTKRIYNAIDYDKFAIEPPQLGSSIRFGLISSNILKKGVWDLTELAITAAETGLNATFILVGPSTREVIEISRRVDNGTLPNNIRIAGYADEPVDALREIDVLLSLSHFEESFGRTLIEAMAASRPVVAYDHGAIKEVVRHKVDGILVSPKNIAEAYKAIELLCNSPELIRSMGESANKFVRERFSYQQYKQDFKLLYDEVLQRTNLSVIPERSGSNLVLRARGTPPPVSAKDLKLAYFCWHFPVPSETFVLNEIRVLVAQGHDVIVFCKQSPFKTFQPDFHVRCERVSSASHLAQRLVETGRNQVHAHFVYPTVTEMVWPACESSGIPFTFIAHAQDIFKYENDRLNRISDLSRSTLCTKVFCLSRYHMDFLQRRGVPREKLCINPNAVDTELFLQNAKQKTTSSRHHLVAICRFVEKKGLHLIIEAAALLSDLDITIDIYGYGELQPVLEQLVAELKVNNVSIKPKLTQSEVAAVLNSADLFLCPSIQVIDSGDMDGIPTALVEAMLVGVPVLTTSVGAIPELVQDRVTGFISDPTPPGIAAAVRRFYDCPDDQLEAICEMARSRARVTHDAKIVTNTLLRVWQKSVIDLIVVSWNNLTELRGVIECAQSNTSTPYHLIICDNNSEKEPVRSYLVSLWSRHNNVTVILSDRNLMVGPGTNVAIDQGTGEYAIYLCAKEAYSFAHGWERQFVTHMDENPSMGIAGTICRSPSYLDGQSYQTGIPLFNKFRNPSFAITNPGRAFGHVQGGLFILRRSMYSAIGGFSTEVPHSYTDVEYSYYAESCGWQIGQLPGMLALFIKSRPTLSQRIEESFSIAHPVLPSEVMRFKKLRGGHLLHCNICDWFGENMLTGSICPECQSTSADRLLFHWMSSTFFMYRRLPALSIGISGPLSQIIDKQFQGPHISQAHLLSELQASGRLANKTSSMSLALIRISSIEVTTISAIVSEAFRLLKRDAVAVFQVDANCISQSEIIDIVSRVLFKAADSRSITKFRKLSASLELFSAPLLVVGDATY